MMMLLNVVLMWASPVDSTITFRFLVVFVDLEFCFAIASNAQFLFSYFLLVCNSLALTLASTAVILGALTAQGKTQTVANASLAANIH
jgi:hypothetical protein